MGTVSKPSATREPVGVGSNLDPLMDMLIDFCAGRIAPDAFVTAFLTIWADSRFGDDPRVSPKDREAVERALNVLFYAVDDYEPGARRTDWGTGWITAAELRSEAARLLLRLQAILRQ